MNAHGATRLLFLCTGNSARSQIAEALLATRGGGRFAVGSAGSRPAPMVNPLAIAVLEERGIRWSDRHPRSIDDVIDEPWDIVITVCDNAKDACPIFPGDAVFAHWGLPDPADATGTRDERLAVFRQTAAALDSRIAQLMALPLASMGRAEIAQRVNAIGIETETSSPVPPARSPSRP